MVSLSTMQLDEVLLLKHQLVLAEVNEARAVHREVQTRMNVERDKPAHEKLIRLMKEELQQRKFVEERFNGLGVVQAEIAAFLGVELKDLHHYTIDNQTGAVMYCPEEQSKGEQVDGASTISQV